MEECILSERKKIMKDVESVLTPVTPDVVITQPDDDYNGFPGTGEDPP